MSAGHPPYSNMPGPGQPLAPPHTSAAWPPEDTRRAKGLQSRTCTYCRDPSTFVLEVTGTEEHDIRQACDGHLERTILKMTELYLRNGGQLVIEPIREERTDDHDYTSTLTLRQLTEALVSLEPFIPRDRPWGSFQDAAIALGFGEDYAKAISNAYVPIVLPLLRNRDGVLRHHSETTAEIRAQEIAVAYELGLPGPDVWPQEMRWDAEAVGAAYARCEYRLLHERGLCGCAD